MTGGSLRGCVWQQRFVCTASEGGELGGKGCQLSRCHAEMDSIGSEMSLAAGKWHSHVVRRPCLCSAAWLVPARGTALQGTAVCPGTAPTQKPPVKRKIIATCGAEGNLKGQTSVIPEAAFTPGSYRSSASTKARAGLWAGDVGQRRKPKRKFTAGLGKVSLAWPPRASTSHREVSVRA